MIGKDAFQKIDLFLVIIITITVIIGIVMIYSAGFDSFDRVNNGLYKKQMIWFILGFILMIGMTFINYQSLGDYALQIYIFLIVILLLTTLFGPKIKGARAWINLGIFSIQPSEFMKIGLVIVLGKYLELRERDIQNFRELIIPSLLTIIPMTIVLLQPDFGTAVIYIPILFTMLFVGGANISHLVSVLLVASIALIVPMILTYQEWVYSVAKNSGKVIQESNYILEFLKNTNKLFLVSGILLFISIVAFVLHFFSTKKILRKIYLPGFVFSLGLLSSVAIQNLFKEYQKKRILVFLNPEGLDPTRSGYQIIQSKIAIGSGGFFGKGFLKGTQSQLGFLPEKSSDFIFSVIAEEWGFFGSIIMIFLLAMIIYRGIQISFEAKDKFGAILASGITAIFFFHIVVNIGMAIGIMPVTGLPLCFVSYGGSNLFMSMIALGILINIRTRKFLY